MPPQVTDENVLLELNAGEFADLALASIERVHASGKTPVLVGGSNFYLDNILYKFDESVIPQC